MQLCFVIGIGIWKCEMEKWKGKGKVKEYVYTGELNQASASGAAGAGGARGQSDTEKNLEGINVWRFFNCMAFFGNLYAAAKFSTI